MFRGPTADVAQSTQSFMTTDFGKTWTRITGDLPAKATWVHVVREDPKNRNLLYLGAEMGVWASWDRGAHWSSLRGDLPVVQVRDIQVHPRDNDLLLATHGRGLYILDDITALQQLESAKASEAVVFDMLRSPSPSEAAPKSGALAPFIRSTRSWAYVRLGSG